MVHGKSCLVLPLVYHLMEKRVNGLVPAVPPDVTPADHDLCIAGGLPPQDIMSEPAFHPPRHAYRDRAQLATEAGRVELRVVLPELANEAFIGRMGSLRRTGNLRGLRRIEIE
jgi:hypothetical protein